MAEISNSTLLQTETGIPDTRDAFIVIVRTEWNASVVDALENGCKKILQEAGVNKLKVVTVPGAFEIPFGIKRFWEMNQDQEHRPHAFIALGCILRGETPHFEYICQSITVGLTQLNLSLPVPVIFGVLTVDNSQQAEERVGGRHGHKGEEAAMTALKMISLIRSFQT